ncbi:RNA-guided endonuclease TnpB family protein [Bacillus mycoides]|uniref:RNA-guided endonuclease TnpB family protein n=1 Tax=Bacillus mycoides TaxID=1405 RepID=UPI0010BE98A4|nr:RNA-guided endonuclease TnpB family protein [Bacillus mycoides]TKI39933.1 IS200/IS605 family element transposase accessory protein TnpB [Bacillus mycoides]
MIITRKIAITIVSEEAQESYNYLRQQIYYYYKALNFGMNHIYFNYVAKEKIKLADSAYKEREEKYINAIHIAKEKLQKDLSVSQRAQAEKSLEVNTNNLDKLRKAISKDAKETFQKVMGAVERTNVTDAIKKEFPMLQRDSIDFAASKVASDFNNDLKLGLMTGSRTLRIYKRNQAYPFRSRRLKFYKENGDFFINSSKSLLFKCLLGVKRQNSKELIQILEKILDNQYKICDSSLEFNKKKLILNLCIEVDENTHSENMKVPGVVKGRIVGVDLGIQIPAYCTLNDSPFKKKAIGSVDDLLRIRTQMQARRRRLSKNLISARGGKGRGKKLKALDRFEEYERNYVRTYNHFISKQIIQFTLQNQAEQINLELLQMEHTKSKSILRNWSYYQLQQMIEYKAKREGIVIKYVDPYHTSQVCSKCGHFEENQRMDQNTFRCKKCKYRTNADYNAAKNIANSTRYISSIQESEYYNIKNRNIAK